jgi:hypothetical protein
VHYAAEVELKTDFRQQQQQQQQRRRQQTSSSSSSGGGLQRNTRSEKGF